MRKQKTLSPYYSYFYDFYFSFITVLLCSKFLKTVTSYPILVENSTLQNFSEPCVKNMKLDNSSKAVFVMSNISRDHIKQELGFYTTVFVIIVCCLAAVLEYLFRDVFFCRELPVSYIFDDQ